MHSEVISSFPESVQLVLTAFAGLGLTIGFAVKYARSLTNQHKAKVPEGDHMVLSATIADGLAVRDLTDSVNALHGTVRDFYNMIHTQLEREQAAKQAAIEVLLKEHQRDTHLSRT